MTAGRRQRRPPERPRTTGGRGYAKGLLAFAPSYANKGSVNGRQDRVFGPRDTVHDVVRTVGRDPRKP